MPRKGEGKEEKPEIPEFCLYSRISGTFSAQPVLQVVKGGNKDRCKRAQAESPCHRETSAGKMPALQNNPCEMANSVKPARIVGFQSRY